MRGRKKELDAIVALLEQEHEDVVELADKVWKLVDDYRRSRELYVVGIEHVGVATLVYGAYESMAQVEKDLGEKGNLRGMSRKDRYKVFKVLSPSERADKPLELFDTR